MNAGQIALIVFQTVLSVFVGIVGWSIKNTLGTIREDINKNADDVKRLDEKQTSAVEKLDVKQTAAIDQVKTDLNNLKSDLPFVYVTREDYIRTMNNVDKQMTTIDGKLDRLLIQGQGGGTANGYHG